MSKTMSVDHFFSAQNNLGEGPLWDYENQRFYWLDINAGQVHAINADASMHKSWHLAENIGCICLAEQQQFVLATNQGIQLWKFEEAPRTLCHPESFKTTGRYNDGKVDPAGRFWIGSIDAGFTSFLYRLEGATSKTMLDGIGVSNGIGWSPDHKIMYYADSRAYTIYQFDYDEASGIISNQRIFDQLPETPEGIVPDGLTVDAEGYIWSARWNGFKVVRYAPDGKIERELHLPVQRPTSVCFGGEALDQLFITSASVDLDAETLKAQPLAGDLFIYTSNIKGVPEPKFIINQTVR